MAPIALSEARMRIHVQLATIALLRLGPNTHALLPSTARLDNPISI